MLVNVLFQDEEDKDIDFYHVEKPGSHFFPHIHKIIWKDGKFSNRPIIK